MVAASDHTEQETRQREREDLRAAHLHAIANRWTPAGGGSAATATAFSAPDEDPTIRSGRMPASVSDLSIPT